MEIVIEPPMQLLWFIFGVPLFVLVTVALVGFVKPVPTSQKVVAVLVSCVASGAVIGLAWHPLRFAWDDEGIKDGAFQARVEVPWAQVSEARVVRNYLGTEYRPVTRTSGTAFDSYRSGWFELANGKRARVFLMIGESNDALLLRMGERTFLYAPRGTDRLVEMAKKHTTVTE